MSTDYAKRLREEPVGWKQDAADEIERLERINAQLVEALERVDAQITEARFNTAAHDFRARADTLVNMSATVFAALAAAKEN